MKTSALRVACCLPAVAALLACGGPTDDTPTAVSSSSSSGQTSSSSSSSGGHECEPVMCAMWCEYGFAKDDAGCDICSCNTQTTNACARIFDEQTCTDTAGCVVVYNGGAAGDAEREPSADPPARAPVAPNEWLCCVETAEGGVSCGSEPPPPPTDCWSDADCGAGYVCSYLNDCATGCGGTSDESGAPARDCLVACAGQCIPQDDCFGAWRDQNNTCRGPADGVLPDHCCVPVTTNCYADSDCANGEICKIECGGGFAPAPAEEDGGVGCGDVECIGYCVPAEPPPPATCLSDDQCAAGQVCDTQNYCESACQGGTDPNSDCIALCYGRCVPVDVCTNVACESGTHCEACGPNMDCMFQCVPDASDCRTNGCGEGESCEPVTAGCAEMRAPCYEDGCEPPPCDAVETWQCVPTTVDPCTSLTESECMYDHDQCGAVYVTVCEECASNDCTCTSMYAGCFSVR